MVDSVETFFSQKCPYFVKFSSPLCGKRLDTSLVSRISGGDESDAVRWPWHSTIYRIKQGSFSYLCGGTLIQSKAVITSGKIKNIIISNVHFQTYFFQLIACQRQGKK